MATVVRSFAIQGIDGYLVDIEIKMLEGQPSISIIGLGDQAVKEAAEFEAQDKKRKEGIDAKNEADAMVFQTEKALQEVGDKLDGADKAAVEADCKALKELLEKANTDTLTDEQVAEIKAGKEKLTESAQKLFTKMYEQAGAAAGAQGAGPQPGANAGAGPAPEGFQGDDVVDGDYKEV